MTTVTFADLTHTGVAIDANNNPLAVAYIAAYARAHLGNGIDPRLFKYPAALSQFLKHETPAIACFTNYMWNERLSCTFAKQIKAHYPGTVIVMGGPNYPLDVMEQRQYLEAHPEIDFFVDGEGEMPFVALFEALTEVGFDADRLRESGRRIPSVHYLYGADFVRGDPLPRILELDRTLPSPYTTGLLDEFFDDKLTPMVQTSRGCPYQCTFCHDGIAYMNKTRSFSFDRVLEELSYIESRVKTATLQLADLNWGMFPMDLRVAEALAETRRRSGWPRNIMTATAKNQKDRIIEMSRVLGDLLQPGASVQSTDPEVLRHIKRTNLSLDAIVRMAKGATQNKTGSFTEIILGLPGDTREKHFKSVYDMLDAGIQDIRSFQFILLPGTEANDVASRERFAYETGFRVLARCFGRYELYETDVEIAEIQEICLGTNTMPGDDYFECRAFDLTVAIFNNGGVLKEFYRLAEALGIPRSAVIGRLHGLARTRRGFTELYEEFRTAEGRNFFHDRDGLEEFLARPGTMDAYLHGEYGVNHIYKARSEALLTMFGEMASLAQEAVGEELRARGLMDPILELYLRELFEIVVARRSHLTHLDESTELTLHFDFPALLRDEWLMDPRRRFIPGGWPFIVRYTESQKADLRKYYVQYGESREGIGQFLQRNDSHLGSLLYRTIEYAEPYTSEDLESAAPIAVRPVTEHAGSGDDPALPDAQRLQWFRR